MAGPGKAGTLGTFAGVFTPSILTILGIILFLRLGYVVGNGGLRNALLMIGLATAVSVLTSISLSAIATNMDVRGGGDYYLISRTLGVEFGGAIGIVLYLAQAVSIAFYAVGFGEALAGMAGWTWSLAPQVIAAAAVAGLFWFAWAGADVASRFQFVVMVLLVGALVSFYVGAIGSYDGGMAGRALSSAEGSPGFWVVFAIFFPAVTGFTQGVSMSGDLRNAGRSLPRGTFAAVGLSTVVYASVAILMAGTATQETLVEDGRVLRSISAFGPLIDAGVIAATLSSAMASFLGAPRILQSLASDKIFPILRPFAAGHGASGNPRRGVMLSLGIALATVALGNLNVIAPVVSMFFLISYGLLNYATYYEARSQSPSFRPRFRFFSRRASLVGALACLGAMLAINPVAGVGAVAVMYLIYRYLLRRDDDERWIDASRSHFFQRAKESIRAMTGETAHPRNWRPQILVFSADPDRRARLLRFATWLEGNSGLTVVAQILAGEGALKRRERAQLHQEMERQVEEMDVDAHVLTVLAPDPLEALPVVVQSFGVGPMAANTVVFGLPSTGDGARNASYVMALRAVSRLGVNVVAVGSDEPRWQAMEAATGRKIIDVWWTDDDTGRLSLLTAYLCTRTPRWAKARIRVIAGPGESDSIAGREAALQAMLIKARIKAKVVVVDAVSVQAMAAASADAGLLMVPMSLKGMELLERISLTDLMQAVTRLPLVAAVMAGQPVDLAAGPESGPQAEVVAAEERHDTSRDRLRAAERQAAQAVKDRDRLRVALADDPGLAGEVEVAEARVAELADRALRAKGRAEASRQALDAARRDYDERREPKRPTPPTS